MKTKANIKKMDLLNIKPLSRAEQTKVMGGLAPLDKPKKPKVAPAPTPGPHGIAIAGAGAVKAL
nr:hypothetical protein [Mucilaginibacter sp. L294]